MEVFRMASSRQDLSTVVPEEGVVVVADNDSGPGDKQTVCCLQTAVELLEDVVNEALSRAAGRDEVSGVDGTI